MTDEELRELADLPKVEPDPGVTGFLKTSKKGEPLPTKANLQYILELDRRWVGRLRYNALREGVEINSTFGQEEPASGGTWQPIQDHMESEAAVWLERFYTLVASTSLVSEVISMIAHRHSYHPIRSYLKQSTWDKKPRLDTWLSLYCGVQDTPLVRAQGRCFLIAAVARVMYPGSKVDTALIFVGKQGARKSSAFKVLAVDPEWFSDSHLDMSSKEGYQSLNGVWIYELAELDSIRHRDASTIKAFLSGTQDKYRPPYGRRVGIFPRQCVFVGTTNKEEFLRDETGDRRFWPVRVGDTLDTEGLALVRDQLWAEAYFRYQQGEVWFLSPALEQELITANAEFREFDPWYKPLADWVASQKGRNFAIHEALSALCLEVARQGRAEQLRVGALLRELGCTKERSQVKGERIRVWKAP